MTIFDAQAARALARRTLTLGDCLASMKKAVLNAAQVGEFEAEALPLLIAALAADPAWAKRREILTRAGFNTQLLAGDRGATLVIAW